MPNPQPDPQNCPPGDDFRALPAPPGLADRRDLRTMSTYDALSKLHALVGAVNELAPLALYPHDFTGHEDAIERWYQAGDVVMTALVSLADRDDMKLVRLNADEDADIRLQVECDDESAVFVLEDWPLSRHQLIVAIIASQR